MIIAHGHCFRHITFYPYVALFTSNDFLKVHHFADVEVPSLLYINKYCISPHMAKGDDKCNNPLTAEGNNIQQVVHIV